MYVYVRMYVGRYVGKYACVQVVLMYSRYKCRYIGKRQARTCLSAYAGMDVCMHVWESMCRHAGMYVYR